METTDGYIVVKNRNGYYEYATKMNGNGVPSGFQVKSATAQMGTPGSITKHLKPAADTGKLAMFAASKSVHLASSQSTRSLSCENKKEKIYWK